MTAGVRQGTVYFIRRADAEGPVKIGFSSRPRTRLDQIDACSIHELKIAAMLKGDSRLELRFHSLFRDSHIRREWFAPTSSLLDVMAQVEAGTFDVESLPEPFCLVASLRRPRRPWTEAQRQAARDRRRRSREADEALLARLLRKRKRTKTPDAADQAAATG